MSGVVFLLITFVNPSTIHGFIPDADFSKIMPKTRFAKIRGLEKEQDVMKTTLGTLNTELAGALTKFRSEEAKVTSEVSDLKSQVLGLNSKTTQLRKFVQNITDELASLKQQDITKEEEKGERKGDVCPRSKGYYKLSSTVCIRMSEKGDIRNWKDSRSVCQEDGGDLITFYSRSEQEELTKYFNDLGTEAHDEVSHSLRLWVGMSKVEEEFSWVSSSTYTGIWGSNQPRSLSVLRCIILKPDGLHNTVCELNQRFVCRISMAD